MRVYLVYLSLYSRLGLRNIIDSKPFISGFGNMALDSKFIRLGSILAVILVSILLSGCEIKVDSYIPFDLEEF